MLVCSHLTNHGLSTATSEDLPLMQNASCVEVTSLEPCEWKDGEGQLP